MNLDETVEMTTGRATSHSRCRIKVKAAAHHPASLKSPATMLNEIQSNVLTITTASASLDIRERDWPGMRKRTIEVTGLTVAVDEVVEVVEAASLAPLTDRS